MAFEMKVPSPGESISEVEIAQWLVEDGDYVEKDQPIAELDSDKATLELPAEEAGKITRKAKEGDTVEVGAVVCLIDTDAKKPAGGEDGKNEGTEAKEEKTAQKQASQSSKKAETKAAKTDKKEKAATDDTADKQSGGTAKAGDGKDASTADKARSATIPEKENYATGHPSPAAKKLMDENDVSADKVNGTGKNGRITKSDVLDAMAGGFSTDEATGWGGTRETERKRMSSLRRKVAERLVGVKNETAMLTTFNEVDMKPIMDLRSKYKEQFKEKFGVSLGFMSFFTKASAEALNLFPSVNSLIDGQEQVFHQYADIGVAVSTPKGLMVPVLRNAEQMSLAEIESGIKELAGRARDGKITIDEMQGGTFTITNGGVFGSMLSTPIINPPQSAILGMHNIVERPIAVDGKVEIRPVMYLAVSYDHRVVDGKESVSFLYAIKEMLENPVKLIFGNKSPEEILLGL